MLISRRSPRRKARRPPLVAAVGTQRRCAPQACAALHLLAMLLRGRLHKAALFNGIIGRWRYTTFVQIDLWLIFAAWDGLCDQSRSAQRWPPHQLRPRSRRGYTNESPSVHLEHVLSTCRGRLSCRHAQNDVFLKENEVFSPKIFPPPAGASGGACGGHEGPISQIQPQLPAPDLGCDLSMTPQPRAPRSHHLLPST